MNAKENIIKYSNIYKELKWQEISLDEKNNYLPKKNGFITVLSDNGIKIKSDLGETVCIPDINFKQGDDMCRAFSPVRKNFKISFEISGFTKILFIGAEEEENE